MLKFRSYLKEIFDKPHPFQKIEHDYNPKYNHRYRFNTSKDKHHDIEITHYSDNDKHDNPNSAHVDFYNNQGDTHVTGEHKKDSHKIIGTVKHIVQHHIKNNPNIKHVTFAGDKDFAGDKGHSKLYSKLVKKHGGSEEDSEFHKQYMVPVNREKENA